MDDGVIISVEKEDVRVDMEFIGEGWCGDYDPSDPGDEPLLRFTVYQDNMQVDDASYCMSVRADSDKSYIERLAKTILEAVFPAIKGGFSVKKLCEALSWLA